MNTNKDPIEQVMEVVDELVWSVQRYATFNTKANLAEVEENRLKLREILKLVIPTIH